MPLAPADFVLPPAGTGELDPSWWSANVLVDALLPVWIMAGGAQVPSGATGEASDAVVRAYVYGTAYDAKAGQIAGVPSEQNIAGVPFDEKYQSQQQKWFENKAKAAWALFSIAVAEAQPVQPVVIDNAPRASFSQPIVRAF